MAGKSAFNSIKIKQEPTENGIEPSTRSEKLTSFKIPRDLTLGGAVTLRTQRGGAGAAKKVYTPNLNAVRNKNTNVKTSRDTTQRGKPREKSLDKQSRNSRGGNRGGLIQASGVFSEGAGEISLRKSLSNSYRTSHSSDNTETGGIRKPTLIKTEGKIDKDEEKNHLKQLLGDSDEDDLDHKKVFDFMPVKLNEGNAEVNDVNMRILKIDNDYDHFKYPLDLHDFFHTAHPQIFLLQLPDSLPGQPPESSRGEGNENEQDIGSYSCSLKQLEEGQIGKIIRYKSGRCKLILGDTRFDLDLGMESGFLQELASVNTNCEERSGSIINLGSVRAKINATPDWEFIFKSFT